MDKLILFADFDFLAEPQPIGECLHINSNEVEIFKARLEKWIL